LSQAPRDENRIPTLLVASSADGTTPVPVYADPVTHAICYEVSVAPFAAKSIAPRDGNRIPTALAVSSSDDITPVVVYGNSAANTIFFEVI